MTHFHIIRNLYDIFFRLAIIFFKAEVKLFNVQDFRFFSL